MKKIILVISCLLLFCGCSTNKNEKEVNENLSEVDKLLNSMTLEEKIGQMLIVSYRSNVADDNLISILKEVKPGGFILFAENFKSYEDAKKMISDINSTSDIPMFMSVDQEGGRVQRIKNLSDADITRIPSMYKVGETNDEELAYEIGKVVGEELRVFGINMDFAPVLDIYSNPLNEVIGDRSFGSTSDVVTKMSLSFSKGLSSTGVIPVYKHFPGHGDTSYDSHYTLPIITKTKEELDNFELIPFKEAIKSGAQVIMIGHLALPNITNDNTPASLSKIVITDWLKNELGYNGLVITDDLSMGALSKNYTKEEIYINAINAGVDLLLMPSPSREAVSIIKKAIEDGKITEKRIDESVKKILELKLQSLYSENIYTKDYLGNIEHKSVISKVK